MRDRIPALIAIAALIACVLEGCRAFGLQKDTLPPDPHHHVIDVHSNPVALDLCQDFRVLETSLPLSAPTHLDVIENQSHSLKALVACIPIADKSDQCQDKLFVEQIETRELYGLETNCFLPWRPFSDFVWGTDNILIFDQWANPHFGRHYVVDMQKRKLIITSAFPDEITIGNQNSK